MRVPSLTALLLLASSSATAAPVAHTTFVLDNGLTVILHEDHSLPRVHVSARVRAGSSNEQRGRTGFAHLFEHLMFEGSAHVPEGMFDRWLEAAGGDNNAWTSEDFTYYYEEVPQNALDLALFVESDRLGFFLDALDDTTVDKQRDIVKNERRQSYENRPYGRGDLLLYPSLFPAPHPYSWPVIGSMEDLSAASLDDVKGFFRTWYAPQNIVLTLVGDFDSKAAAARVRQYFGELKRGTTPTPSPPPQPSPLQGERRVVVTDRVELPRVTLAWPGPPAFAADEPALEVLADVLGGSRAARLSRRLRDELQLAQDVSVGYEPGLRASLFYVEVLARPGLKLSQVVAAVDATLAGFAKEPVTPREVQRAQNQLLTALANRQDALDQKASALSAYHLAFGNADGFDADAARIKAVTPAAVVDVASRTLTPKRGRPRVVLSVVPAGSLSLAAQNPSAAGGAQ